MLREEDVKKPFAVHLLDVGQKEYGDAILCQFGDVTVLIDGAHTGDQVGKGDHKSIPDQLKALLKQTQTPLHVTMIMVSHAHEDHIGCLPHLVSNGLLTADFALVADPDLGWGRPIDSTPVQPVDERVRQIVAGLRELIRTKGTDDQELAEFLADAATLEDRYRKMLDTLDNQGTVIRHGRDNPKPLIDALAAKGVELKVLGPSQDFLAVCADRIGQGTDAAIDQVSDAFRADEEVGAVDLYWRLTGSSGDAIADSGRLGAAVNLQSIVARFTFKGKKFLFAGDMQFEDPEISGVDQFMKALRKRVSDEGPYAFVKLCHHGSFNAFSEQIYQELNQQGSVKLFGICAGEQSTSHPNPSTLKVLKDHTNDIKWARTDHNRQSSFFFGTAKPTIKLEKGDLNDPKPNSEDPIVIGELEVTPTPTTTTASAGTATTVTGEVVEVNVRVPHRSTKVTLTIDVEPRNSEPAAPATQAVEEPGGDLPTLRIAGGRTLAKLLFVTSAEGLARNIGRREAAHVLQSLRAQNQLLFDQLPPNSTNAAQAATLVRSQLRQNAGVKGIVIIGGYDVVPSQRVDCLPPALRSQVSGSGDADNFIVWSDDVYGDTDGDWLPELPVSRIPDGNRANVIFNAIQSGATQLTAPRAGVRNIARPFAEQIFAALPGSAGIRVSRPTTFDGSPRYSLSADRVYLMLHGDYTDGSRFWGEDTPGNSEAVNISNLPARSGAVIFTGCCWGALTVNTPAGRVVAGRPFGQKSVNDSIALTFLQRGALGFIGCTGSHYSPLQPPYKFFGGPMHEAFWSAYGKGHPPAEALFLAKLEYLRGMPHGQTSANARAIEYKILRQYTCLGLGW
jgi:beta-lactamase superfamily II metal-dependent hydrolase